MINITPENFEQEVLKSKIPVIMLFAVKEWCKYCDEFKPIFEEYAKEHPEIKCVIHLQDSLSSKPTRIASKYSSNRFPNAVSFKNWEHRLSSWNLSEQALDWLVKFAEDLSDSELMNSITNIDVEMAQTNLEIARMKQNLVKQQEIAIMLNNVMASRQNRLQPGTSRTTRIDTPENVPVTADNFPLPPRTVDETTLKPCEWGCQ